MADDVIDLLRPADLLVAQVTLQNLRFEPGRLVRVDAGADARIVVHLPTAALP